MSGSRFARTGRCRFLVCLGILVLMLGMVAIFHSSQVQLNETRAQRLHCEQQQEALNERLKAMVEQKFHLEKNHEHERHEQMETRRHLEQKLKDLSELQQKEKVQAQARYDKLQHVHKVLQGEHNELIAECTKSKKEQLENANALEKKLQSLRSELQKEKNVQSGEMNMWREKYNMIEREKTRLEALLNMAGTRKELEARILELESQVDEYRSHCKYTLHSQRQQQAAQLSKPLSAPKTGQQNATVAQTPSGRIEKSFSAQESIVPKTVKRLSEETETQLKQQSIETRGEGGQVPPLSSPNKRATSSTQASKSEQQQMHAAAIMNATSAGAAVVSGSSSSLPPLPMPPSQRKLPANVAPIPDNFEVLLQKANGGEGTRIDPSDTDGAVEDVQNNVANGETRNNRYANVVDEIDAKAQPLKDAAKANEDSVAHDNQNFNLPGDEDNHFFDNEKHNDVNGMVPAADADGGRSKPKDDDQEDEDILMGGLGADGEGGVGAAAGDIAVKNNQILDADNLNNEVAGDQGKEFGDGLRLEDGGNDEDEDEDDYSNLAARQQGAQAIRN